MSLTRFKTWCSRTMPVLLLVASATVAAAQGTVTGRVTDAASGQPVAEARVFVVGTNIFGVTNSEGRYTARSVPAGSTEIRVLRVGFTEQKKTISVNATQPTTLDFALTAAIVKLQEVVTTATGETRRIELGNSISQVATADIMANTATKNIGDLLTARAPGVQVLPATITGGAARVRIRGVGSLSLSNDPIYVIDGVRMTSDNGSSAIGVGGTTPSRVGDINTEDIENIEVVKGPSAATLYGTDAANGVIVITTKRGRNGPAKWGAHASGALLDDRTEYPRSWTGFGHTTANATSRPLCILATISAGTCLSDSTTSYSPLQDPDNTPLTLGNRRNVGLDLSGGNEQTRFFTSAEAEVENGVYKLDDRSAFRLDSTGVGTRAEQLNPNRYEKYSVRANLNSAVSPTLDLGLSSAFTKSDQRLPQIDNNVNGLYYSLLGGPGYRTPDNLANGGGNGYGSFVPAELFQFNTGQSINRALSSLNANWRPTSWLSNRGDIGVDYTSRLDTQICRRSNCPNFGSNRLGFVTNSRGNIRTFVFNLGSTANFDLMSSLNSRTTVGTQYTNYAFDRNTANAATLPPGTQTVSAGAVPSATTATTYTKTLGAYVEQSLAIRDRLFITGAVRTDQNSAFGTNFQKVVYPKASLSYIISDEGWFPHLPKVDQIHLRSAYGAAGQQPGPNDAIKFFAPITTNLNSADQGGVIFSYIGNADLKPERASEFEGGFDAKMFSSRVNIEITYYSKLTKDALIQSTVPPTAGTTTTTLTQNLGSVKNAGVEALLNAQIIDRRSFGWDVTFSGSSNQNKLVSLGNVPPQIGAVFQQRSGYPLNSYWSRRITGIDDKNKDGIITFNTDPAVSEIAVTDTAVFLGISIPKYEVVMTNGIDLFQKRLRITALFDAKGGNKLYDNTNRIRCVSLNNCRELIDKTSSFDRQAAAAAVRGAGTILDGYFEDARFIRFRELGATITLPQNAASRLLRADRASIAFSARNLHRWTRYLGTDPEANYNSNGDQPLDLLTPPPPTTFQVRLNVGF